MTYLEFRYYNFPTNEYLMFETLFRKENCYDLYDCEFIFVNDFIYSSHLFVILHIRKDIIYSYAFLMTRTLQIVET